MPLKKADEILPGMRGVADCKKCLQHGLPQCLLAEDRRYKLAAFVIVLVWLGQADTEIDTSARIHRRELPSGQPHESILHSLNLTLNWLSQFRGQVH